MVIDIIIALVIILCIIVGLKRGFIKTLFGFFSYVAAIILGYFFYDAFVDFLYRFNYTREWIESFKESVADAIVPYFQSQSDAMPAFFSQEIKQGMIDTGDSLSDTVANVAVTAVSAILFIILLIIGIKLIFALLSCIVKLPVLKQFNSFLGGAMGLVNGVILCYVVGAVVLFYFISSGNGWVDQQLQQSLFGGYFYKNNLILNILVGFH